MIFNSNDGGSEKNAGAGMTSGENLLIGTAVTAVDGFYTVLLDSSEKAQAIPRGVFRHDGTTLFVGDRVKIEPAGESGGPAVIVEVLPRRTELLRPPVANVDRLLIMTAAARPRPVQLTTDKLLSIAEHNGIEPVIIISKADLAPKRAEEMAELYRKVGCEVFVTSGVGSAGAAELKEWLLLNPKAVTAFAGVSGVGKSTLLHALFPEYEPRRGAVGRQGRGRHTTREVTLHKIGKRDDLSDGGGPYEFLADTPGFSLIDMRRFDFFELDDLPYTFRDFLPYLPDCRYTDCRHLRDEDCAVLAAVADGKIAESRHESYRAMYEELESKNLF
ncbi:MAG: ribosome small subunit-dependent GTPase A [Clostridiales bacterium]|nr:ribosome small subunit-dependent GTPase A [Clostridiales bacterium]